MPLRTSRRWPTRTPGSAVDVRVRPFSGNIRGKLKKKTKLEAEKMKKLENKRQKRQDELNNLEEVLKEKLVGQHLAIKAVSRAMKVRDPPNLHTLYQQS